MTSPTRVRRAAAWCVALAVATVGGCSPGAPGPGAGDDGPAAERVAPYVDVTLDRVPDLAAATRAGVRRFTLAFVTAGVGCEPAWGGALPAELALRCGDAATLAAAYRTVVDAVGVERVDFDVEGTALADAGSVHRRNVAVARLQAAMRRAGTPLRVSYTLPVDDAGLTADARQLLRDARSSGVRVDAVNLMTMNYGTGPQDLVDRVAVVTASTKDLVRQLWPGTPERTAWGMVAVTPMIGVNDVATEVLGLRDAARLVELARRRGLAWLSFWSMNRDRACGVPPAGASDYCSGVPQREGDFTKTFAGYATAS